MAHFFLPAVDFSLHSNGGLLVGAVAIQRPDLFAALRVARDASHSYASGDTRVSELTDMWTFIAARLNVAFSGAPRSRR